MPDIGTKNPPIGTIICYGGPRNGASISHLHDAGWLHCDGTSYAQTGTYGALYSIIGTSYGGGDGHFNVPDLRGRFVRGVDRTQGGTVDPDRSSRTSNNDGGNTGGDIGSEQPWATGLPSVDFIAASAGVHKHTITRGPTHSHHAAHAVGSASHRRLAWEPDAKANLRNGGAHEHTIDAGGDIETRPRNLYLHFLIKYSDGES